ncbi:MAG TPA: Uma2 family endonuclease [Steroidobacteraceae bacterium]|jgi:Uma2 family endonuclease
MQPKPAPLSPAEYLDREAKSLVKSEYVNGEIYAMSGAKRAHNLIASNLVYRARGAATGSRSGCQVFGSDMKVYVETHNSFYYPDLSVCCDRSDRHDLFVARPCFIIEVVSPSTALIDRREKRASYTTLESLREYGIVDQDRMHVELYRRESSGWRGYLLNQPDDVVESSCLGLRLSLKQIYEGVGMPPPGVAEPMPLEYAKVE